jgi:hypothetical protein
MKNLIAAALALTLLGGTAASARTVVQIGGSGVRVGLQNHHRHYHPHYYRHHSYGRGYHRH